MIHFPIIVRANGIEPWDSQSSQFYINPFDDLEGKMGFLKLITLGYETTLELTPTEDYLPKIIYYL